MPAALEGPQQQALATSFVSNSTAPTRRGCGVFPLTLRCCPCLPTSWTKVQDWLHLVLIIGVLASIVCVVQLVYELTLGDSCKSPLCFKQIISGIVVLPSTVYFIKTIGTYDEQLREKKERHREEVENLVEVINSRVADLNALCRNIAENANEFAMGRFNDKCENFKRFLMNVAAHHSALYADQQMLQELRKFVIAWLRVFASSLINPQSSPLMQGAEEELRRCSSAQEICGAAVRRIDNSRVAFQFQMPAEQPMVTGRLYGGSFYSDNEAGRSLCCPDGRCGVTWVRFGRCHCRREWSPTADGMPLTLYLCCCRLRVLSRPHANLLVAFFVDILLILFEVFSTRWTSLALVAINEVCIVSMLVCFEQINEIAQLERQIHMYEQRRDEVVQRRDQAKSNWDEVQKLHDLWLYRTLPSLAIMGKIHNRLADEDMAMVQDKGVALGGAGDNRFDFLKLANESLDALELKLGPVEAWRGEERDEGWKQSIGQQLRALEGRTDVADLLYRLPIITQDLSQLEAPPPSSSMSESLPRGRSSPPGGSPRASSPGDSAASSSSALPDRGAAPRSWRRSRQ